MPSAQTATNHCFRSSMVWSSGYFLSGKCYRTLWELIYQDTAHQFLSKSVKYYRRIYHKKNFRCVFMHHRTHKTAIQTRYRDSGDGERPVVGVAIHRQLLTVSSKWEASRHQISSSPSPLSTPSPSLSLSLSLCPVVNKDARHTEQRTNEQRGQKSNYSTDQTHVAYTPTDHHSRISA